MSTIRVEKRTNFTVVDNTVLFDNRLGNGAKGIFDFMMALPPTWDYTVKGLLKFTKDGYTALSSDLKELEMAGYLVRTRTRNKKGHLGKTSYVLYETPQTKENVISIENKGSHPEVENPILDNPILDNPIVENRKQLNTNGIKDLTNQSLKELKGGSSTDRSIKSTHCASMYNKAKNAVSNLQVPIEVSDLFNRAMKKLLKESHLFHESGVKSDPENVAELLDNLSDKELDSTMIQVLSGYMLSLESEKVIHRPDKLMMMIIYNALIQNQQVALMEKHIYASI